MKKPHFFAVAAVSIDGFIARYPGHKSDWTSPQDKRHLHEMEAKADVLLLARKSFEIAKRHLTKKNCIVLTRRVNGASQKSGLLAFLNPKKTSLQKFAEEKGYKKICVLGGRAAYNYCLRQGLLDDIFLTIEPVVFGQGITMFDKKVGTNHFVLVSVKKLNHKGTVLLHYRKKKKK